MDEQEQLRLLGLPTSFVSDNRNCGTSTTPQTRANISLLRKQVRLEFHHRYGKTDGRLQDVYPSGRRRRPTKRPLTSSSSSSSSRSGSSSEEESDNEPPEEISNSTTAIDSIFPVPPASVTNALLQARQLRRVAKREDRAQARKRRKVAATEDGQKDVEDAPVASSSHQQQLQIPNGIGELITGAAATPSDILAAFNTPNDVKKSKKNKKARKKKQSKLTPKETQLALLTAQAKENNTELKYWCQRYTYFSLFDHGCKLDRTGWFSVTPELIAIHQAERCRCDTVIDAYAGVGGNTIQFAMTCYHVIAIELDPQRLELARHNARIYGVENRIEFICGDYLTLIPKLKADVVFLAPPWGGVDYTNVDYFNIETMIKPNGFDIFRATRAITSNIAYCLPRNILPDQVKEMTNLPPLNSPPSTAAPAPLPCELEENCVGGKVKMMTAYFGELVNYQPPSDAGTEEENQEPEGNADYEPPVERELW